MNNIFLFFNLNSLSYGSNFNEFLNIVIQVFESVNTEYAMSYRNSIWVT